MATLTFQNQEVDLKLTPTVQYRLAQAGYSFPGSFASNDTIILASVELLRICSNTKLSGNRIAAEFDKIGSFEPLIETVTELFEEEEAKLKPEKGDPEGNES